MAPEAKRIIPQVCGMRGMGSSKNEDRPVEILMAVYNGEKYIGEQIDSILSQTYQNWFLVIRDDESNDQTLSIIREYEKRYHEKIRLIRDTGNHLGVCGNFRQLLMSSRAPYVMLCDQDDVWLPEKIELTLQKMIQMEHRYGRTTPLLVFTDLEVVDDRLNTIHESFWDYQQLNPNKNTLNYLLLENIVTGCTTMMNARLRDIAQNIDPNAMMHDWWIALVASVFGAMEYIEIPTVRYRQHAQNVVGSHKFDLLTSAKNLFNIRRAIIRTRSAIAKKKITARAFYETYKDLPLKVEALNLLKAYSRLDEISFPRRVFFLVKNRCFLAHPLRTLWYLFFH